MPINKERPQFSRRKFIKGGAVSLAALIAGCRINRGLPDNTETDISSGVTPEASPTDIKATPTATTETPTTTPKVNPTAETTPEPELEIQRLSSLTINERFLNNLFTDIGGYEDTNNGEEQPSAEGFGQNYISTSWRKEFQMESLADEPIDSLKYLLSLADFLQQEGFIVPGMKDEELIFPSLENAYFARIKLETLPESLQQSQENNPQVNPEGLTIAENSHLTIIGVMEQTAQEAVARASGENVPDRILVSVTDQNRVITTDEAEDIPLQHFAIIPSHSVDSNEEATITLSQLLAANGYQYDAQNQEISLTDKNLKTILEIGKVRGDDLTEQINKELGLYFISEMKGEVLASPIVPYPEEMPENWTTELIENQDGTKTIILLDLSKPEEDQEFGKANYNFQTEQWEWQLALPELLQVIDRDGEQFQVVENNGVRSEILLLEGLTLIWNVSENRWDYQDSDGERVAYWIAPQTEEGQGRVEITYPLSREGLQHLDFEKHRGLFSTISAQEAWRAFQEQFDQDEQLSITLPLNISNGGVVEQKKVVTDLLVFRELPKNTIIVSPISGPTFEASFGMNMPHALAYYFENDKEFFAMVFPKLGKFLVEGRDVLIGQPTINLQGDTFGPDFLRGLYKNHQLHLINPRSGQGIAFDNLTKDSFGRITYLSSN